MAKPFKGGLGGRMPPQGISGGSGGATPPQGQSFHPEATRKFVIFLKAQLNDAAQVLIRPIFRCRTKSKIITPDDNHLVSFNNATVWPILS